MKKIINKLKVIAVLAICFLSIQSVAFAQCATDESGIVSPNCLLEEVSGETNLENFSVRQHSDAPPDYSQPGAGQVATPILFALDLFKFLMSGVALLVVVYSGIKLIVSTEEETMGKVKNNLIYGIAGLLIIQLVEPVIRGVIFGEQGEAFEDAGTAELFAEEGVTQLRGIIGLIQVFIGVISIFVLVIRGYTVIFSAGDEESLGKAKTHITYAVLGLLLILTSEVLVRGVIFPDSGEALPDAQAGRSVIAEIANYISGFIALISFVSLFAAGYQYVVSGGDEEALTKVKKVFLYSAIGLILSLGAYAFINTVLEFEERSVPGANNDPVQDAVDIDNL